MTNGSLRITPLLYVDEVEKSLPFWTDGLGFEKTLDVEENSKLLFALLKKGEQELMLNARALVQRESPAVAEFTKPNAPVYIDVENLGSIRQLAKTHEVVVPEHKTSYGTSEIILREPGGNLVWFASHE
ncbi:MAG TPA: VOC family protein [Candidatus Angelobacter sp.]